MSKRIWLFMIPLFITGVFLASCDNTTSSDEDELISILKEIVEADSTIMLDGLDDDGAQDMEYSDDPGLAKALADTFPVSFQLVRFGRKLNSKPTREVNIEVNDEETEALAEITSTRTGYFVVILKDTVNHTIADSVWKPFTEIAKQKLKLEKKFDTGNPRRDWKVTAFSPIIARTVGNTIEITDLSLKKDTVVVNFANDETDSLLDHFFGRYDYPALKANGFYRVEMSVSNPDPFFQVPGELAIVHYGIRKGLLKRRRPLQDPEDDDSFTGDVHLHGHRSHMCRVFFDVIDLASIFDTDAPLNSTYWAFPYRVKR